ncbi:MAG: response regulator [Helicobacteraceae bacterium]|nr:response regulator [Candidatus Sulfurimonas ponti]
MKKYILIGPVFLISLIVIAFYIERNIDIAKSIQKLTEIKQLSYELELVTQKRTILFGNLDRTQNYDAIVNITKEFQSRLNHYTQRIQDIKDKELINLLQKTQKKNAELSLLLEDLKTDTAVVNNSLAWLGKIYQSHLLNESEEYMDKALLSYIFSVLNSKNEIIRLQEINSKTAKRELLQKHLRVIYEGKKSIQNIHKEIKRNDIVSALDTVVLYTLRELNSLHKETESIIQILAISSIFLLVFGFIVYIREIIVSLEAQKLKNELQQFVDALNESAIVSKTDAKGVITYVNKKFCQVSGFLEEELIGESHSIIKHPDMPKEIFKDLWKTIQDKKVFKAIIKNRTKEKGFYFVDTSIMPILELDGTIREYLAVRYDVTELVHARDMAIVGEKAKSEFLSNMSHELRTPLNAIVGFSSVLSRGIKDAQHLKHLNSIQESSANLIGLIDDILDLSKLQSGKFSLDYKAFDLKESTRILLESFASSIENSELDFEVSIEENADVNLNGDCLRISQIMSNLISNAIKFTPKGKKIEFKLAYRDSKLFINVVDEGIGLSQEAQEKIFKAFEQADSSTTRNYGGTGLGLSIVLDLVEQMKGRISLESIEGEGSNFGVVLPLEEVKKSGDLNEPENESEDKEALRGHVLIAEDNKTNQMLIGVFMEEFGLSYEIANDGVEAVDMFGREKFDVVLMDENMPNLNGCDAMHKIHSLYGYGVPIIALTANAMIGDRERFLAEGMDDYVSKPIDDDELYKVIKKCLKQ